MAIRASAASILSFGVTRICHLSLWALVSTHLLPPLPLAGEVGRGSGRERVSDSANPHGKGGRPSPAAKAATSPTSGRGGRFAQTDTALTSQSTLKSHARRQTISSQIRTPACGIQRQTNNDWPNRHLSRSDQSPPPIPSRCRPAEFASLQTCSRQRPRMVVPDPLVFPQVAWTFVAP